VTCLSTASVRATLFCAIASVIRTWMPVSALRPGGPAPFALGRQIGDGLQFPLGVGGAKLVTGLIRDCREKAAAAGGNG